jgi:hypothetical protein
MLVTPPILPLPLLRLLLVLNLNKWRCHRPTWRARVNHLIRLVPDRPRVPRDSHHNRKLQLRSNPAIMMPVLPPEGAILS